MDMMSHAYDRHLKELVEEGKVTMAQVDESVRRVLRVKFRLGLFERPYTPVTNEKRSFFRPQSMAVAAQLAAESMVLLKMTIRYYHLQTKKDCRSRSNGKKWLGLIGFLVRTWKRYGWKCYDGLTAEFGGDAELRYAMGCKPAGQ